MSAEQLLLLEDDADQRQLLQFMLEDAGYQVTACASVAAALQRLEQSADARQSASKVQIVLSDWKLAGDDGLQFLIRVQQQWPDIACVLMTAYGSLPHAVQCIRAGLDDYLSKPFEKNQLLFALAKVSAARARQAAADSTAELTENLAACGRAADNAPLTQLDEMIGAAPAMQTVFQRLRKIADTQVTVLITGESGTGKELAARALHRLSSRRAAAFVALNCAAMPETLFEAELFGAERGAYTGADKLKIGRIEAASGGTLFLDEIGEMPPGLQAKLLRVLQEGVYTRLGHAREHRADVRIVAATNRDLQQEVQAGRFRADLFYRLHVVPLRMPALQERREDIPLLVRHFVDQAASRHGRAGMRIDDQAVQQLATRDWPGNVRELAHAIERLVVLADGNRIAASDVQEILDQQPDVTAVAADPAFRLPAGGLDWELHERELLAQALSRCAGNRTQAARLLKLPYKAFLYRLDKHGLNE